jgi:dTDP-glucose pyrophosphorylase
MKIDWRELTVQPEAPLLEALQVIDRGGLQFALVMSEAKLVGIVTDGDVRRALMRGVTVNSPIKDAMNARPVLGTLEEGPAGWRRKMRDHSIRHLPLTDAGGRMQRLISERTGADARDNWVVLMAGGLGTRLRPITEKIPKPMIDVGGRPILETIIGTLAHSGFQRVFLSVNYRAEAIERHFGNGHSFGVQIEYLRESKRLGTAGALSMLPGNPAAPMLLMNGDVLTGMDLGEFIDSHAQQGACATVGVREFSTQIPYGVVELEEGRVLAIREKPDIRHWVSAGIYALSPQLLPLVPAGEYFDMPTLLEAAVAGGYPVRARPIQEYWIDVGRLDDLESARQEFESGDGP